MLKLIFIYYTLINKIHFSSVLLFSVEFIYYYLNNTYLGSGGYRDTSIRETLGSVRGAKQENTVKVIVEKKNGQRMEKSITVYVQ